MYIKILSIVLYFAATNYVPEKNSESQEQFLDRMGIIAKSIEIETKQTPLWNGRKREDLIALIAVIWNEESQFSLAVHEGKQRGAKGRAACLGQIQANAAVPPEEWKTISGVDLASTRRCAMATIRMISLHAQRCLRRKGSLTKNDAARILEGYGSGRKCTPEKISIYRAQKWLQIRKQLAPES